MKKLFITNVGDLTEIQRASFYFLLLNGISTELNKFPNPCVFHIKLFKKLSKNCLVFFYSTKIKCEGPLLESTSCLDEFKTYSINIYVPGEYVYTDKSKKLNTLIKTNIFLGEIPLMTEDGTFIINGCEKIVVSQMLRSPGLYFRKEIGLSKKIFYTATLISDRGIFTKFILDSNFKNLNNNKNFLTIQFNNTGLDSKFNKEQLSLIDICSFFGLSRFEVLDSIKEYFEADYFFEDLKLLNKEEFNFKKSYFKKCFNSLYLNKIGRYNLNKKLNLNLSNKMLLFTSQDLLRVIHILYELSQNENYLDDIDNLKAKRVRSIGDLMKLQISNAFSTFLFAVNKNQRKRGQIFIKEYRKINLLKIKNNYLKSSVNLIKVNYNDFLNEYIFKSKLISSFLRDFFNINQLVQFMDQQNPLAEITHKRRISVFGTEGLTRDNINVAVRDLHPSQYNRLCLVDTPEGQNAGLINSLTLFSRINELGLMESPYFLINKGEMSLNKKAIYLTNIQEENSNIGFCDSYFDLNKTLNNTYISTKKALNFILMLKNKINFITPSSFQMLSIGAGIIPFLEHNDANRTLMGSNMQRQAMPLLYCQKPLVFSGLETLPILTSSLVIKTYSEGIVITASSAMIQIKDKSNQIITYYLKKYFKSNQNVLLNNIPNVWKGEHVFSGQVIVDGPCTLDGELSVGTNLTIAYMSWEGYNYEDAVIINENLIYNNCLSSLNIYEYETIYSEDDIIMKNENFFYNNELRNLNDLGIIKIGSYVKKDDILVSKLSISDFTEFSSDKLFNLLLTPDDLDYYDESLRVSENEEGRVLDIRVFSKEILNEDLDIDDENESVIIRIYIGYVSKIQLGDKVSGRHGNKGIISKILSNSDMPYLIDGTPIDIIFNPLGIPSRMNVGQIFECLLGFASENLGTRFQVYSFDESYGLEASRRLVNQKLKEASIKSKKSWLFNKYYPGKIFLKDGRTGEFFDNPILVGKSYILKLVHIVEKKIHSRSVGPYSLLIQQPLQGKSHSGGQRFGEMEVWALEAYGCSYTLQELLTIKSDDIGGRTDLKNYLLRPDICKKAIPSITESFLVLIRELNALGLDFTLNKFEDQFLNNFILKEKKIELFRKLETCLKLRKYLKNPELDFIN
jgi:DNA-directed RNA polymerase subunit beta